MNTTLWRREARDDRRGAALISALFAAAMTATLVAVLFLTASAGNTLADVERHKSEAKYMASGAVEAAKKDIQEAIANWEAVPVNGAVEVGDDQIAYTIEPSGLNMIRTDSAGIQTIVTGYEVEARARSGMVSRTAGSDLCGVRRAGGSPDLRPPCRLARRTL